MQKQCLHGPVFLSKAFQNAEHLERFNTLCEIRCDLANSGIQGNWIWYIKDGVLHIHKKGETNMGF